MLVVVLYKAFNICTGCWDFCKWILVICSEEVEVTGSGSGRAVLSFTDHLSVTLTFSPKKKVPEKKMNRIMQFLYFEQKKKIKTPNNIFNLDRNFLIFRKLLIWDCKLCFPMYLKQIVGAENMWAWVGVNCLLATVILFKLPATECWGEKGHFQHGGFLHTFN